MIDFLLSRSVVVILAVIGALLSILATVLQRRGVMSEQQARIVNYAGYGVMGVSMLLFVLAGLLGR